MYFCQIILTARGEFKKCLIFFQNNHPNKMYESLSLRAFPCSTCRDIIVEYSKQVMKLGKLLFELLSEALDLQPSHLNDINCSEGLLILGRYYPSCPQTELTLGTSKHADNDFLTVLLQDHIGGHQVLHHSKWVDVLPVPGALVVNIGDLQASTNYHLFFIFLSFEGQTSRFFNYKRNYYSTIY